MRMIYHQRDNRRRRLRYYYISSVVIVLIAVLWLANRFFPNALTPVVQIVGIPVSGTEAAIGSGATGLLGLLQSKASLANRNAYLESELAAAQAVKADFARLQQENMQLQNLKAAASTTRETVIARVISKPGFSAYDTAVLKVGSRDGIKVGDKVLVDGIEIVGEISHVATYTSTVLLYSTPDHKSDVLIGPNGIEAVAVGQGGGNFSLKLPRNTSVAEGDSVLLANYSEKIFGIIQTVTIDDSDSFENILFRNPVSIENVKFVVVEKMP